MLADATKQALTRVIDKAIQAYIDNLTKTDAFQAAVRDVCETAIADVIANQLPALVTQTFVKQIVGSWGMQDNFKHAISPAEATAQRALYAAKVLKDTLEQRGIPVPFHP